LRVIMTYTLGECEVMLVMHRQAVNRYR
jgi:hypothetical protein